MSPPTLTHTPTPFGAHTPVSAGSRLPVPAVTARSALPSGSFLGDRRAGSRLVLIVDGSVHFRDQPDYPIPASRLQTAAQILGCVSHLMTKPWITPETARAFIEVVCQHRGIRIVETA